MGARTTAAAATVVYGHTPIRSAEWLNNTICLDTGCVFGGKLTALRWPERELVAVPAEQVWYEPARPLDAPVAPDAGTAARSTSPTCTGRRLVETGVRHGRGRGENAAAALEVMSRFAVDPRWLLYLPPTMAPVRDLAPWTATWSTRPRPSPTTAADGVDQVVCEEKHMGSRAVALVCRDAAAAPAVRRRRRRGALHTRTGRPFFDDPAVTEELLGRLRAAVGAGRAVGRAGHRLAAARRRAAALVAQGDRPAPQAVRGGRRGRPGRAPRRARRAGRRGRPRDSTWPGCWPGGRRAADAAAFTDAYRRYCWPTDGLDGVTLAPFQMLACAGALAAGRDHD